MPDLLIWVTGGPCLCVEVKRPHGGVMSDGQKRFQEGIERVGHIYRVVRSFKEMEILLAEFGCTLQ